MVVDEVEGGLEATHSQVFESGSSVSDISKAQ